MSVNVKDYTVFCVPSKVHCWYCWLFCALCQSGAVYWTITYLMYATGSHDNTTWDEVILFTETVRRWYTLYVVFSETGVHKQQPLVTYGAALCISGLSLVCRRTSQCSIYILSECFLYFYQYIHTVASACALCWTNSDRKKLTRYCYFLNPITEAGIVPKVKWNSAAWWRAIDIYLKWGPLIAYLICRKCKHIWDFSPCPWHS